MKQLFVGWRLFLFSLLLTAPFFTWAITRIAKAQRFDDNCVYHLGEAMKSTSSADYSKSEMERAVKYIEDRNLTSGFTSIVGNQPDENLSLWYYDIRGKQAYIDHLHDLPSDVRKDQIADHAEYVNAFNMHRKDVDIPNGISIYPYNTLFFVWSMISIVMLLFGIIGVIIFIDQRSKATKR
jgi:hypothetical protein